MATGGERFDLGRRLFFDPDGDHVQARLPRGFERQHRKAAIARDHSYLHLMNPRADLRMNSSSSSSAGVDGTASRMRSIACEALSFARVTRRNALCRASIVAVETPRRSRPVLFSANTFTL